MPGTRANVKNEKQYEALEEEGDVEGAGREDRELARRLEARRKRSGSGGDPRQGGTTAQKKAAGRKGGKATAAKHSK